MNCDDIKTMLAGYADGELSPIEADAVVAHLEQCGRCRQIVRDQQRIQHVLDAHQPPAVPEARWNEIGKRLRAELEGKGERTVLRTRPRIEGLEPTPIALAALGPEETRTPVRSAREVPEPGTRPGPIAYGMVPSVSVFKVPHRKRPAPFGWVAHVVGAIAAALVISLGLGSLWVETAPPLDASTLARNDDVAIMEVQMMDADYSVAAYAGDATDVAAVWVVPNETNG